MNSRPQQRYEFGPFQLDTADHCLLREGQPVPLTPKVFDLLEVLVRNSGRLVEKDELLKEVWPDSFVEEGNLNRNISILQESAGRGLFGEALYRDGSEARLSVCWQCETDSRADGSQPVTYRSRSNGDSRQSRRLVARPVRKGTSDQERLFRPGVGRF